MMVRYSGQGLLLISLLTLACIGSPDCRAQTSNPLLKKLQMKRADSDQLRTALFTGEERALICGYCHGNDGNSVKPEVPNLAGQNADYLLVQIGHFASGERKDFVMNSLASKFSDDDQINLTLYYSAQKVQPSKVNKTQAIKGGAVYIKQCQGCHGEKGLGKPGFARLAGQKPLYLKNTLLRFRDNATGQVKNDKRRSAVMEPIVRTLTDQDIEALAAYIAGL